MTNPFYHRKPIKSPEEFYGRKGELRKIYSHLIGAPQAQSCAIVGQRRIGKSSLLYQVYQKHGAPAEIVTRLDHVICVFVTFERLVKATPEDFYKYLLRRTIKEAELVGLVFAVPDKETSVERFELALERITEEGYHLIVLLDEFDLAVKNQRFDEAFFSELRAISSLEDVGYVTATTRGLHTLWMGSDRETNPYFSPFFNIFATFELGLFSEEEARQFLQQASANAGRPFSEQDLSWAIRSSGLHPFFLQIAAAQVFELRETGLDLTDRDYVALENKFFSIDVRANYEYYWKHLMPYEQQTLLELAYNPKQTSDASTNTILGQLAGLSLVVKQGTVWLPFSESFRRFLLGKVPAASTKGTNYSADEVENESQRLANWFERCVADYVRDELGYFQTIVSYCPPYIGEEIDVFGRTERGRGLQVLVCECKLRLEHTIETKPVSAVEVKQILRKFKKVKNYEQERAAKEGLYPIKLRALLLSNAQAADEDAKQLARKEKVELKRVTLPRGWQSTPHLKLDHSRIRYY